MNKYAIISSLIFSIVLLLVLTIAACEQNTDNFDPLPASAPYGTFMILHLEVGNFPEHQTEPFFNELSTTTSNWQEFFYPTLVSFVDFADQWEMKLTLLVNPQWIEFFMSDTNRTATLRGWIQSGHEIGLQHHGADHIDWNGFTERDLSDPRNSPAFAAGASRYRGDIKDMMTIMNQLGEPIVTGTVTDIRQDGTSLFSGSTGLRYEVNGWTAEDGLRPPARVENLCPSLSFIQLGMYFVPGSSELSEAIEAFENANSKDLFGFVMHEINIYAEVQRSGNINATVYADWFRYLNSKEYKTRTVRTLMQDYEIDYSIGNTDEPIIHQSDYPNDQLHSVCKGQ